jgi:hypothetical protein
VLVQAVCKKDLSRTFRRKGITYMVYEIPKYDNVTIGQCKERGVLGTVKSGRQFEN